MPTRGEQMLALRKARMAAAPAFLRGGFRPFFFGGPLWAVVALALWLCAFFGGLNLPTGLDALSWHRHEMLFGFAGAAIAGFLLTAIPNWTGRLPIAGSPLAALFGLWAAGRAVLLFSADTGLVLAAVLDVGFYLVLALVAGREVIAARNRNKPVVLVVLLFGAADAIDYAGAAGLIADSQLGHRAGIALVIALISLIGGRIVPSFTRNWMARQGWATGLPNQPDRFDLAVLACTVLGLLAWVSVPDAAPTGIALIAAASLQLARLARWRGWRTIADPLVRCHSSSAKRMSRCGWPPRCRSRAIAWHWKRREPSGSPRSFCFSSDTGHFCSEQNPATPRANRAGRGAGRCSSA